MYDLIVIGGGPAGLSSAYKAYENGVKNILIIERDEALGGILNQCIHNGFGLHKFKEELTGPEYAQKYIDLLKNTDVKILLSTMVMEVTENKEVHILNENGYEVLSAKAIILAMGCRERTRGAISIPGHRPAGVFTAGTAQRYINMEGYTIGKNVLILGSGDIGLIMARRMSLEGYNVVGVVELMEYSNGLTRNIVQCLDDYNIPLYLSHTVIDIIGKNRLEKVIVSKVDENKKPIKGTEIEFEVDTLLLSVGLIPENEIPKNVGINLDTRNNGLLVDENMETSIDGIFACGNTVHVHDLVDFVSDEGDKAGISATNYINGKTTEKSLLPIKNGAGISYTVPQHININTENTIDISFRVNKIFNRAKIQLECNGNILKTFKKPYCLPAEMERIKIEPELLKNLDDTLTISVVDWEV